MIYEIKNRAQLNVVILDAAISGDRFRKSVIDVLVYSHSSELTSILKMSRDEAIFAVASGVMIINKSSSRSLPSVIDVSPSLKKALEFSIGISQGCEYLFQASLSSSNRAQVKDRPVSRQAVWKWIKSARDEVVRVSRNAGLSEYINLSPMSIISYKQGENITIEAIERLVAHHGSDLTESALSELRLSVELLKAR